MPLADGIHRQYESPWCYKQQPKQRNRYREYAMGRTIEASSFDLGRGKKYFSSQPRLKRFCDTPSLYTTGTEGSFSGYKGGRGVKLTVHLHLAPTSKTHGAISPPSPPPKPPLRAQGQFYLHHLIFVYERCTADSYTNDSLRKHRHTTRKSSRTSDKMKVAGHNVQCVLVEHLSTLRKICGTPTWRC